jgi:hypothetical protein
MGARPTSPLESYLEGVMERLATIGGDVPWGTGQKLTRATIIVAGVASLVASLLSIVYGPLPVCLFSANILINRSIWLQTYNFILIMQEMFS